MAKMPLQEPLIESVTEESIALLIDRFYAKVRGDPVLAPVFSAAIASHEWPEHLATMRRFWSSVMLTSGQYSGDPVAVHRAVRDLKRSMFPRWLQLFEQTAHELFEATTASLFVGKAHRIAGSLELAVFHQPGGPPDGLQLPPRKAASAPRSVKCD
jgi:hemoglobin